MAYGVIALIFVAVALGQSQVQTQSVPLASISAGIKKSSSECFTTVVNRLTVIPSVVLSLVGNSTATSPPLNSTKCFVDCVMISQGYMSTTGAINVPAVRSAIATISSQTIKQLLSNNVDTCVQQATSADQCLKAYQFLGCFAGNGLLQFVTSIAGAPLALVRSITGLLPANAAVPAIQAAPSTTTATAG